MKKTDSARTHYCVLYTQTLRQWEVTEAFRRVLPDGEGEVFYPCVELWWHGEKTTRFKPLFPGYLFIRSEMEPSDLHYLILKRRSDILSFVKELRISEIRTGVEFGVDETDSDVIDLSDEEASFFDYLLGFDYDPELDRRREEAAREGKLYLPPESETQDGVGDADLEMALHRRRLHLPPRGVLQMSFGYREGGRIVIMDGPLRGHEDRIVDYKPRDRKAYLDIRIGNTVAKAGVILLGKRVWFPKDDESPDILDDGTEIDCRELTRLLNSRLK